MDNKVKFAIEDIERFKDDTDPELAIARVKFLSTKPNSHKINITEEILERDAKTILGKFLIGKMNWNNTDTEGHESDEVIFGYFIPSQEILFTREDGYLTASADAVVSKLYATSMYDMFLKDNKRKVSVEMTTLGMNELPNGEIEIDGINLTGATVLGKSINPSCPNASMEIIQFSEQKADEFYHNKVNGLNDLKTFAERRKQELAEKKEKYVSHPINQSKEAMYTGDWNGDKAKKDLIKEKDFEKLAPMVCMELDADWQDRTLSKLKYPVMMLHNGEWVYSREGLASAKAYANNPDRGNPTVAKKVEAIYKKLDLEDEDKEKKGGDAKMKKEKFAVDIGNIWGLVYSALETKYPDREYGSIYRIYGIYEQSNKKFVVIHKKDEQQLYRLDFDLTEAEGLVLSEEIVVVEQEFVEGDKVQKFEMPDGMEKYTKFEDDDKKNKDKIDGEKLSSDANVDPSAYAEMLEIEAKKNEQLAKDLEDKDNIIMGYETELAELRKFKEDTLEEKKMAEVNSVLAKVKDKMEDEEYAKCEKEGMECKFEEVTAWKNSVLANLAENVLFSENKESHMRMSFFREDKTEKSLWDRL